MRETEEKKRRGPKAASWQGDVSTRVMANFRKGGTTAFEKKEGKRAAEAVVVKGGKKRK